MGVQGRRFTTQGGYIKETPIAVVVLVGHGGLGSADPQGGCLVTATTIPGQDTSSCIVLC
jgi:hypothetical protein